MSQSEGGEPVVLKFHEISPEVEAVYYSALASLDELQHGEQALVVMNWVKYVLSNWANHKAPGYGADFHLTLVMLCHDFAVQVIDLPEKYDAMFRNQGCGNCARCKARGVKPPEASS